MGFPFGVGAALLYMNRRDQHTNRRFLDALGWVLLPMLCIACLRTCFTAVRLQAYCPYEARWYLYGVLVILRRTAFALISHIPHSQCQSVLSSILVAGYAGTLEAF